MMEDVWEVAVEKAEQGSHRPVCRESQHTRAPEGKAV